jgi:organic hydroperoxide reductase OsmC/OhrA
MEIKAVVTSSAERHDVVVRTGASSRSLNIPSTSSGGGSGVSGGEFLMLAVATCYCNDLYREAERLVVPLDCVEVEASAEFPGVGLAATNIRYRAKVASSAPASAVARLLLETDTVAEVHNTIRAGLPVHFVLP